MSKYINYVILGVLLILVVFLFIDKIQETPIQPLQPYIEVDTTKLDSLKNIILKLDSNITNIQSIKHENTIKFIKVRDSIINLSDSAKDKYITDYISNYKSIKY